jgi:hypothetical protein
MDIEATVAKMREDFPLAALHEGWNDDDQAEIGGAIAAVIKAGEVDNLASWARHLAASADKWREWCDRVRLAEVRAKEAGRASRLEREAQQAGTAECAA